MRTVTSFEWKRLARGAGFVALGSLGSLALTFPLFGALAYVGALFLPLLLAWFVGGIVLARAYVFGNLGMLAATFSVLLVVWLRLVIAGEEPNPAIAAPLDLALVVAGLLLGVVVGLGEPQARV